MIVPNIKNKLKKKIDPLSDACNDKLAKELKW